MEGLIIMAVIYFIGKMFLSKNEKPENKADDTMPPFLNTQPPVSNERPTRRSETTRPERPKMATKSLEDFANEVFGQLQQKQAPTNSKPQAVEAIEPKVVERVSTNNRPALKMRSELGASRPIIQREKQRQAIVTVPTTRNQLVQSIVMAEVLGPPKAKQKR